MNYALKLGALALMLMGSVAGAQTATQEYCSVIKENNGINFSLERRPEIVGVKATNQVSNATFNIPLDGGPDGTLDDSVSYGGTTIPYGSPELYYYGNGFEYKGDFDAGTYTQNGVTNPYSTGSYTWSDIEAGKAQIIYIQVQARRAGFFGRGRGARMELSYKGTPYARFDTRPDTLNYAPTITALNGASLRGREGERVPQLITTLTNTGPFWEYFVVLPEGISGTGDIKLSFKDIPPVTGGRENADTDDIFFTTPRGYGGGLCLQERDTLPNQRYQIMGKNANNLEHAINVTEANTNYPIDPRFKTIIERSEAILVSSDNVSTPGSRVRSLNCTKSSSLPPALRGEFSDTANITTDILPSNNGAFKFRVKGLETGVIADCLISNDSSQKYPIVNVTKKLPERIDPADQFKLTAATTTPENSNTAQTTGTASTVTTQLVVRPTYARSSNGQQLTEDALPKNVTVAETPLGNTDLSQYTTTLTCTNSAGSISGLPNNLNATSATLSGLTYNDVVDCTFLNAVAPKTTVSTTKTGQTVVTAGTAVTYNLKMTNKGDRAVYAQMTDAITQPGSLPAKSTVSPSGNGTYDANTQTVTWPAVQLAPSDSRTYKVTIDIPDPVNMDGEGTTYSGPTQVTNRANANTFEVAADGSRGAVTKNTAPPSTITTNHLFAQIRKTVSNLSNPANDNDSNTATKAKSKDTLQYCLNFENQSAVPMNLTLTDDVVTTQTAPTNFTLNGEKTGFTNNSEGNNVSVTIPDVAAGAEGSLCFEVTVN